MIHDSSLNLSKLNGHLKMFFICAKKLASPVNSGQFDIVICN